MIEHSGTPCSETINMHNVIFMSDADVVQNFHEGYLPEDGTRDEKSSSTEALDIGYLEYGYVLCLIHDGKLISILSNHSCFDIRSLIL